MKYSFTESELKILKDLLLDPLFKKSATIWLFGSRARGDHQKFSDVDILYSVPDTLNLSSGYISEIKENLENSNFPYKVDLVDINSLAKSYYDNVMKDRVELKKV